MSNYANPEKHRIDTLLQKVKELLDEKEELSKKHNLPEYDNDQILDILITNARSGIRLEDGRWLLCTNVEDNTTAIAVISVDSARELLKSNMLEPNSYSGQKLIRIHKKVVR